MKTCTGVVSRVLSLRIFGYGSTLYAKDHMLNISEHKTGFRY